MPWSGQYSTPSVSTPVPGALESRLIRSATSDTLPGVAIAISLAPPLRVAGLAMESGAWGQSLGALLLFVANVADITLEFTPSYSFDSTGPSPAK